MTGLVSLFHGISIANFTYLQTYFHLTVFQLRIYVKLNCLKLLLKGINDPKRVDRP